MVKYPMKKGSAHTAWPEVSIYLVLLFCVFAVYSPVRDFDFVNYDDPEYVTDNPHVRNGMTVEGARSAFTSGQPLTTISHMLDCQLFGLRSGAHHMVNVAIHALSALLLFALLKRMTGARWRSAFVAMIFAVHPLHLESVAWLSERKDVLCGLFWFLTLLAYSYYTERVSAPRYLLVLSMFCCGLMSKPMIVTLPVVTLLLDFWPLNRFVTGRASTARLLLEKLPLFVLTGIASWVTFLVQQSGGAVTAVDQIPVAMRVENALVTYVIYLYKFVWPTALAVLYPYVTERPVWQPIGAGIALAVVTILVLRQRARRPYLAAGWLWYLVTLLPVIGLIQVGVQARADRYMYIPMIGILIVSAWGLTEILERRPHGKTMLRALGAAACTICLGITWIDLPHWRNSISLFQHTVEVTTGNHIAYNNLGAALRREGRIVEAVSNFQSALRINPEAGQVQNNLGEALLALGRTEEAIPHLEAAARLVPGSPKAYVDLGSALTRSGRMDEAAALYQTALRLGPDSAEAHYGLGAILMKQGRRQEALPHLQAALPSLMDAVRVQPGSAYTHYNLGVLLDLMERRDEAIAQFAATVRLRPEDAEAQLSLGADLAAEGRLDEAVKAFAAAVRANPEDVRARFDLGRALAALGSYDEAIHEFSEVLRLHPDFAEAKRDLESARILRDKSGR